MEAVLTGSLLARADTILSRGLCCETDMIDSTSLSVDSIMASTEKLKKREANRQSLRSRTWRDRRFGYDIFVSYSARDNLWATNLEALLKFGRFRVFREHIELNTGDHLDRLLKEVRRSTMLLLLVSDD